MIKTGSLDRAGMLASTICAIHCALIPLLLGVLPVIGLGWIAHSWFEWTMVSIAALVGTAALTRGHAQHRRHTAWCFFIPGIILVLWGLMAFTCSCTQHEHLVYGWNPDTFERVVIRRIPIQTPWEFPWRAVIMAVGGFTIATAHFINNRLCKACVACDHTH